MLKNIQKMIKTTLTVLGAILFIIVVLWLIGTYGVVGLFTSVIGFLFMFILDTRDILKSMKKKNT